MPKYEIKEVVLSQDARNASRLLRRYFFVLTSDCQHIPKNALNWLSWEEYVAAAIECGFTAEQWMLSGKPFSIESDYLDSSEGFAFFGSVGVFRPYVYTFENFNDVIEHYISHEKLQTHPLPLEKNKHVSNSISDLLQLANNYDIEPKHMLGVCLCLLKDVVVHSGPDSEWFYHYLTNDSREGSEFFDIDEWEKRRCAVLGRFGEIERLHAQTAKKSDLYQHYSSSHYTPNYHFTPAKRKRKCVASLNLHYCGNQIMEGMEKAI